MLEKISIGNCDGIIQKYEKAMIMLLRREEGREDNLKPES